MARSRIDVFKFSVQSVLNAPCDICGGNTLPTFVGVQAFEKLADWGIAIGIDAGAVKEWDCTGTEELGVASTAIDNVRANGGTVSFLDMDEPFLGGEAVVNDKTCGYTMQQTAAVTVRFLREMNAAYPNILVGNTEPYPYFSVAELKRWTAALEERGTPPAYFHLDVDMVQARTDGRDVVADLKELSRFFHVHGIPFGVIFTANSNWNAASDRAYFDSTMDWLRTVDKAIGKPQHVLFQSWLGPAPSGAHELPVNLPEDDPSVFSHTRLVLEGLAAVGRG